MSFKLMVARGLSVIPDKIYISIIYRIRMRRPMNWKNPKAYSEKLQWLKLYDRNPEYVKMVDKYEMKKYVDDKIGEGHTVPTIGVWDSVENIEFEKLPDRFVIKGTHDSGSVYVCKNRNDFDFEYVKSKLEKCLKHNMFYLSREWPYKNVKPRILAEEFIEPSDKSDLIEYKLFCFNGEVKMVLVCKGKAHSNQRTNDFCDISLRRLPFKSFLPNSKGKLEKPEKYDKLIEYASILSEGIPQLRVDAYVFDDKIIFGELTFFHNSGLRKYEPEEWDYKIGEWLELPDKMKG